MSNNNAQQKRARDSGHPQKKANADVHQNAASSSVSWQGSSGSVVHATEGFNKFPSDFIPNGALQIATQFDTRWPGSLVDQLTCASVEIQVQNASALPMVLVDPSVWFSRIDVMSNGANVDYVIYDIMFYIDKMSQVNDLDRAKFAYGNTYNPYVYRDDVTVTNKYAFRNYDTSTAFAIPALTTETFYIQYPTIMTDAKLFLPALKEQPRLRFYTGNNIQTTASFAANPATPNLISVITYLRGYNFSSETKAELVNKYSSRTSLTRSIIYERQTFTINITSAQESTDQLLTSLTGSYAWLFPIVSAPAPTQEHLYSDSGAAGTASFWKKITDMTLLDENQNPINFNKMPVAYLQQEVWGNHWESAIPFEKEISCLAFSTNCQLQRQTGQDLGSRYLNGNFTFRFTPLSVAVTNVIAPNMTVELIILAARVCIFAQKANGTVMFKRLPC